MEQAQVSNYDLGDTRYLEAREKIDSQDWGSAIGILKSLTANTNPVPAYWNDLGFCYLATEQIEEAVEAFQNSVEEDPSYYRGHFNLGNTYARLGKPVLAEAAFEAAVESNPNYFEAWYNLGILITRKVI